MLKRYWILLVLPLLLAACASDQQKADYAAVENSPVSPAIYDKMVHGDSLSVSDIVSLSHARVNDGIIVRYIRDHGTIYYLGQPDIQYLQSNGVSPSVIDYMVQTGRDNPPGSGVPISIGIGVGGGWRGGGWR